MNFYLEAGVGWLVGNSYVSPFTCEIIISGDTVTVKSLYIPNTYYIFEKDVTEINDSASTQYANIAAFKTAVGTFLIPA
ncbi:MAG: hypothetical protein R3250_04615 [Melioribacteraceae bacterium]|nr:hypothetical protein [Melioribacteraceae bacterium]